MSDNERDEHFKRKKTIYGILWIEWLVQEEKKMGKTVSVILILEIENIFFFELFTWIWVWIL